MFCHYRNIRITNFLHIKSLEVHSKQGKGSRRVDQRAVRSQTVISMLLPLCSLIGFTRTTIRIWCRPMPASENATQEEGRSSSAVIGCSCRTLPTGAALVQGVTVIYLCVCLHDCVYVRWEYQRRNSLTNPRPHLNLTDESSALLRVKFYTTLTFRCTSLNFSCHFWEK